MNRCLQYLECLGAVILLGSVSLLGSTTYTAERAGDHIGEQATVCGVVASTHFAPHSRGKPTFLNLDKPYPIQIFTVVIWGDDRPSFESPEGTYKGKSICVTGVIQGYVNAPEIVARNPSQIAVTESEHAGH